MGFDTKSDQPATVALIPGRNDGKTDIVYSYTPTTSHALWEVAAIDENPRTADNYTGYMTAGDVVGDFGGEAFGEHIHPGRLSEETTHVRGPIVMSDGVTEGRTWPVEVGTDEGRYLSGSLRRQLSKLSAPDSSLCADWIFISLDTAFVNTAIRNQHNYLPGRCLGFSGSSVLDDYRSVVSIVVAANSQYNQQTGTSHFDASPMVVIVGGPGEIVSGGGPVVNAKMGYAQIEDVDSQCYWSTCLSDGSVAVLDPDEHDVGEIRVPYTRIPARTLAQVKASYDMAKAYSAGSLVDPIGRIVQLSSESGTICNNAAPGNPLPAAYVNNWTSYLAGPKYPMIHQGDADKSSRLNSYLASGAAMCVGFGHLSDFNLLTSCAFEDPYSYSTNQLLVVVNPSCATAQMLPRGPGRSDQPYMYLLHYNYAFIYPYTRMVYGIGFTDWVSYLDNEQWGLYLLGKLGVMGGGTTTWQDAVFEAQRDMGTVTNRWHMLEKVGNIGAPTKLRRNITTDADVVDGGVGNGGGGADMAKPFPKEQPRWD